jgi:predicted Co/Zn/Cd cation transporter (cation efflux family)
VTPGAVVVELAAALVVLGAVDVDVAAAVTGGTEVEVLGFGLNTGLVSVVDVVFNALFNLVNLVLTLLTLAFCDLICSA